MKLAGYSDEELSAFPPEADVTSFGRGNPVYRGGPEKYKPEEATVRLRITARQSHTASDSIVGKAAIVTFDVGKADQRAMLDLAKLAFQMGKPLSVWGKVEAESCDDLVNQYYHVKFVEVHNLTVRKTQ